MRRFVFIVIGIAIIAAAAVWYLSSRTGIGGAVVAFVPEGEVERPLANATIEVWQADSLLLTATADDSGNFFVHLAPGSYDLRVHTEGFTGFERREVGLDRFERKQVRATMQPLLGYGALAVSRPAIDSTTVLPKANEKELWQAWRNVGTGLPHRMTGSTVPLASAPQTAAQAVKAAHEFLKSYHQDNQADNPILGAIDLETLAPLATKKFKNKWFVTFGQSVPDSLLGENLPVYGSFAHVTISGKHLTQFGLDLYPAIELREDAQLLGFDQAMKIVEQNLNASHFDSSNIRTVIFPLSAHDDSLQFKYVRAYEMSFTSPPQDSTAAFEAWTCVVDAATGHTLFRQRRSIMQASGILKTRVYAKSPEESELSIEPVTSGEIGSGQDFVAIRQDGSFQLPSTGEVRDLQVRLRDSHFALFDTDFADVLLYSWFGIPPTTKLYVKSLSDTDVEINPTGAGRNEVTIPLDPRFNSLHHLRRIRSYFIQRGVEDYIDHPLKVGFLTGLHNAFYSSVNDLLLFGSLAEPLALRSDVVYHEYGHAVVDWLVNALRGAGPHFMLSREEAGAINEGIADYFACVVNNDSEMRAAPPGHDLSYLNRDLKNQLKYQDALKTGEIDNGFVHDNSRIFSGILWDLRELVTEKAGFEGGTYVDDLIIEALIMPPAPEMFVDFGVSLLLADDNDGRLFNGTPNFAEIAQAFANHGLVIPAFEQERPTIQNLDLISSPQSPPSYIEEGRPVTLRGLVHDDGYGIDSIVLEINGNTLDLKRIPVSARTSGMVRIRHQIERGAEVRRTNFGDSLRVRLRARDQAGNQSVAIVSKSIEDHVKPTYKPANVCRTQDSVFIAVQLSDFGSGVDPGSIKLRLDGEEIKSIQKGRVDEWQYLVSLRYPIDENRHTVTAEFADRAGNLVSKTEEVGMGAYAMCLTPCAMVLGVALFALTFRRHD